MPVPSELHNVTVVTKANVYFDGAVISHTVHRPDKSKITLGVIRPGSYHFNTGLPERMEIVAGECEVQLDGHADKQVVKAGGAFDVPGNSGFNISVASGLCEYLCIFIS
jgi:purine/pyrimidine-nucleoside phosphorylase